MFLKLGELVLWFPWLRHFLQFFIPSVRDAGFCWLLTARGDVEAGRALGSALASIDLCHADLGLSSPSGLLRRSEMPDEFLGNAPGFLVLDPV